MRGATTVRALAAVRLWLVAALVAAALAGGARAEGPAAGAVPEAAPPPPPAPPIQITADAAEYFNKENQVVFTGNVVAVQGDTTLTSQRMEVTFSPAAAAEGGAAGAVGAPSTGRRVTQIVALQSVTFRQVDAETKKERFATGEKGVYDADQRLVTMTGNPRLWEGKNVMVGEQIVFHLGDKNVNVRGKVNLTVYPDEAKEPKKP